MTIQHDESSSLFFQIDDEKKSFLRYEIRYENRFIILEVFVDPSLRGRGIAQNLVDFALKYAADKQYIVVPFCSFAKEYMKRKKLL